MIDPRPYKRLVRQFERCARRAARQGELAGAKFNSEQATAWKRYIKGQMAYAATSADFTAHKFGRLA